MARTFIPEQVNPYDSATELREANVHLLEGLNRRLGQDDSPEREAIALLELESQIRMFLERGTATGAFIEDISERTACQVLLDYWASTLTHAGVEVPRAHLAGFDATRLPDLKDKPCPFVGSDAFDERALFFGREKAVTSLLDRVAATPLVVVQGASGSGKSSIVTGGALPVLGAADHVPPYRIVGPFTPGNAVLEGLAAAVASALPRAHSDVAAEVAALRADPLHLVAMLGEAGAPAVLLVIDQFEEVFALSDETDRNALATSLAELLRARPDDRVILTLREEFSGRLEELVSLRPYLAQHAIFSMKEWPMGYEELKAAVERPAALVNLQFQPGIVDDMVKSVLSSPDTAPVLLQFALRLMWEKRDRNRITWDVYEGIGGNPLAAFEASADAFYAGLESDEQRREVERILLELVRVDRLLEPFRQPVLRSRLLEAGTPQTAELLALLEHNDFVRITPALGGRDAVVEVSNEALVRNWTLYGAWIEAKRERVRQRISVTEAAQRWERGGRSASQDLLSGWQLQEVQGLPDLTELENEYVQASRKAIERQSTWRRRRAVATAVGIVVLFFWFAVTVKEQRNQQRQDLLREMAAAREASISGKLDHALTGALTATSGVQDFVQASSVDHIFAQLGLGRDSDPLQFEALATLLSVFRATSDVRRLFIAEGAIFQAVAFHPERGDALMAFAGTGGRTYLSLANDEPLEASLDTCASGLVTALAFDGDGRWLAAGCADGTLSVWSTSEWERLVDQKLDRTIWTIAFSPDGRLLAAGGYENKVKLFALSDDGRLLTEKPLEAGSAQPEGWVWSMTFSPTGDTLLVGDGTGHVLTCSAAAAATWNCARSTAFPKDKDDGDAIRALAFSPDPRALAFGPAPARVAVGHWNGDVEVYDASLSSESRRSIDVSQIPGPVYSLAFFQSCGLEHLAVGKGMGLQYRAVDAVDGEQRRCIELPYASVGDEVYGVAFHSPSGLLAAATRGGYVAVLDPARTADRLRTKIRVNARPNEQMRGAIVAEEKDATTRIAMPIALTEQKHNLEVLTLRPAGGDDRVTLPVGEGEIVRVSASVKTRRLATLSRPGAQRPVTVWRFDEGFKGVTQIQSLSTGDLDDLHAKRIAISPDGQWLAVSLSPPWRPPGKPAQEVEHWCEQEPRATQLLVVAVGAGGRKIWVDAGLCSGFRDVEIAFSADSQFFAAGGDAMQPRPGAGPGRVALWRVGPGSEFKRENPDMVLTSFANKVMEVAFAAPERGDPLLVAGGEYGAIDVWNLRRHEMLPEQRVDSGKVWLLASSPGGTTLAASDDKHVVRLWDMEQPERLPMQLSAPTEHIGVPGFLAFAENGAWLASAAWLPYPEGGTLHLWDLDVDSLRKKACSLVVVVPSASDTQLWRKDGVCP